MNKKQRKARLKYLKQLQRGPDPKAIKRRQVMGLLMPNHSDPGKCDDCLYQVMCSQKPGSPIQKFNCVCPERAKEVRKTRFPVELLIPLHNFCPSYKPLN